MRRAGRGAASHVARLLAFGVTIACGGAGSDDPMRVCRAAGPAGAVIRSFWEELDRKYAVFDMRLPGRSWAEVGVGACDAVSRDSTARGTFSTLVSMARTLDDGHIQITAPSLDTSDTGWGSEYAHGAEMAELVTLVERRYASGRLHRGARDRFRWGWLDRVGYLDLGAFEALGEERGSDSDVAAVRDLMPRIARDLRGAQGLIVDLRNNEGGYDAVGLEVARWFQGPRTLSYWKARRAGPQHDALGPWEEVWVAASPPGALEAPIVLLVSGWTFSAAETFALSMRVRPRVVIMGERTSGHFSDLVRADLPNGWRFTYSGERYRAADGVVYEARGLPIDLPVTFDLAAFREGRDPMLEMALRRLRGE